MKTTHLALIALPFLLVFALDLFHALPPQAPSTPKGVDAAKTTAVVSGTDALAFYAENKAVTRQWEGATKVWSQESSPELLAWRDFGKNYKIKGASDGWTMYELRSDRNVLPTFSQASVSMTNRANSTTQPCPRQGNGFQCGSAPWMLLAPKADMRINGRVASCIWAHPKTGHDVVIRYPKVKITSDNPPLYLKAALDDRATSGQGAPVNVSVSLKGTSFPKQLVIPNRQGWRTLKVRQDPYEGPLTLTISTPNDGRRHFCFRFDSSPN